MLPTSFKGESIIPVEGKPELQVESGVFTTRLQLVSSEERRNCNGSNNIENCPAELVVALEITFPAPHSNCIAASANQLEQLINMQRRKLN